MSNEQRTPESETEKSPRVTSAEEGLVDPRDLVDSESPVPEVIRPEPLSDQCTERESNQ